MKFVALVSGGKDSFYSIQECVRNGHELVACAHLSPRKQSNDEDEESYMYQTAASECIPTLVEECLGVPLVLRECVGRSKNTSLVYDHDIEQSEEIEDEVEDLYELLLDVKRKFPEVKGISSGAILSTYQRTRIESVCGRLGLTSLGYLWRIGQQQNILECMLKDGIDAVLVKVASPPGLMPRKHLNKSLGSLYYGGVFTRLKEKFDFHVCGEGGEYETLVLDCPLFKKRLVLTDTKIVEGFDGVGILKVNKCEAVEKDNGEIWSKEGPKLPQRIRETHYESEIEIMYNEILTDDGEIVDKKETIPIEFKYLPQVKVMQGGLCSISEILSQYIPKESDVTPSDDVEVDLAVLEAKNIFQILRKTLETIQWTDEVQVGCAATPKDVVFVHLYLSNISHFAKINKYYSEFFGSILPPSRSCVSVGKIGARRVMMDCMVQRGSGEYMRILPDANVDKITCLSKVNSKFIVEHKKNPHHKLRENLHVQSISHYAPICVGPYSQANTLRSSLHFLAGQIGLNPGSMTLVDGGWSKQLLQSWRNAASVLDSLDGSSLEHIIGCVIYIGSDIFNQNVFQQCKELCEKAISCNGGITAGLVDEIQSGQGNEDYGGFEDYETYKAVMADQNIDVEQESTKSSSEISPYLMVVIPQMPVGAKSEVELICATRKAFGCLEMKKSLSWECCPPKFSASYESNAKINWDSGYDGLQYENREIFLGQNDLVSVESTMRSIGNGCAAVALSSATLTSNGKSFLLHTDSILLEMLDSLVSLLEGSTGLGKFDTLNLKLFYIGDEDGDDGSFLRSNLNAAVGCVWNSKPYSRKRHQMPAVSLVPVTAMKMCPCNSSGEQVLSMQLIATDLVHMESEIWIHHRA